MSMRYLYVSYLLWIFVKIKCKCDRNESKSRKPFSLKKFHFGSLQNFKKVPEHIFQDHGFWSRGRHWIFNENFNFSLYLNFELLYCKNSWLAAIWCRMIINVKKIKARRDWLIFCYPKNKHFTRLRAFNWQKIHQLLSFPVSLKYLLGQYTIKYIYLQICIMVFL